MIYVLENVGRDKESVKIVELKKEVCLNITASLSNSLSGYKNNTIEFDGSYKPENDESLFIKNFYLPNEITEAINNPLGVTSVSVNSDNDWTSKLFLYLYQIKRILIRLFFNDCKTDKY